MISLKLVYLIMVAMLCHELVAIASISTSKESNIIKGHRRGLYQYPHWMGSSRMGIGGNAHGGGGYGGPGGPAYGGPGVGGNAFGGGQGGYNNIWTTPNGGPVFVGPVYGAPAYGGTGYGGGAIGGGGGSGYGGPAAGGPGYGRRRLYSEETDVLDKSDIQSTKRDDTNNSENNNQNEDATRLLQEQPQEFHSRNVVMNGNPMSMYYGMPHMPYTHPMYMHPYPFQSYYSTPTTSANISSYPWGRSTRGMGFPGYGLQPVNYSFSGNTTSSVACPSGYVLHEGRCLKCPEGYILREAECHLAIP